MFDIALDQGYSHFAVAPTYSVVALDPSAAGGSRETQFKNELRQSLEVHRRAIAEWKEQGVNTVTTIEQALKAHGGAAPATEIARLRSLADTVRRIAGQRVNENANVITTIVGYTAILRHEAPQLVPFMRTLKKKFEAVLEDEIDFLVDASMIYRGLASTYDPDNKRGPVFDNADELVAHLEKVCQA